MTTKKVPARQIADYGSWASPISADLLTAATIGLSEIQIDGDCLYWLESRPREKGRTAIVQYRYGQRRDLLPPPLNARSKVNEYGGGSYCVSEGVVYFVLFDDQRIYCLDCNSPKAIPIVLTSAGSLRFGDLHLDHHRNRLIAVCEDHGDPRREAETSLVSIDLDAKDDENIQILQRGADFYATPCLSPDGQQLSWLSWNHPNMPWDASECWLATIAVDGGLREKNRIAGGDNESIAQPRFAPDGTLYFISDRSNWWNLYRRQDSRQPNNRDSNNHHSNTNIEAVCPQAFEFAGPQWVLGQSCYSFVDAHNIIGCYTTGGQWHLYRLNVVSAELTTIDSRCTDIAYVQADSGRVVWVGANAQHFAAIYQLTVTDQSERLAESAPQTIKPSMIASAQALSFDLSRRAGQGQAFYYPPTNGNFCGPDQLAPPLLVFCHGGPTAATRDSLNLKIQYWTSRGIAVVDVNYGGSTGFGRDYRQSLNRQWGVVDVQDCIDCVRHLVNLSLADPDKVAIRGGSAGGYTVLCALTFHHVFKAGASHYGVGDLETLATDTHKFESRYLDSLIGPYPEQQALYRARSPIHHLDQLACPVIFFQGLQDKVVPPNQAQAMVEALDKKGIAHAYVTFAEEGHGFRQAENQRRAIEAELYFYSRVFGFQLADRIEPVTIHHLTANSSAADPVNSSPSISTADRSHEAK